MMQRDDDEDVRVAAISALAHFVILVEWQQIPAAVAPPVIEALLAEFEKPDLSEPAKRAALEALGAANHPKVPKLIEEAYESDSLNLQLSAVFAMGANADSRWLPIVIDEMESHEPDMRAEAARAAGEIGGSDAVDALANLTLDEETAVALAAIGALGQIGGSKAEEILQEISRNPEFEDLFEAVEEALEEITWLGGEINFDWLSIDNEAID
jgi:HEAT repeat protein